MFAAAPSGDEPLQLITAPLLVLIDKPPSHLSEVISSFQHYGTEETDLDFLTWPGWCRHRRVLRLTKEDVWQRRRVHVSQRRFEGRERPAAPSGPEYRPDDPPQPPQEPALQAFSRPLEDVRIPDLYGKRDVWLGQRCG